MEKAKELNNQDKYYQCIAKNPLGIIIPLSSSVSQSHKKIDYQPFILKEEKKEKVLLTIIDSNRAKELYWAKDNAEIFVTFHSTEQHIKKSWCVSEHGKTLPILFYMAVHVHAIVADISKELDHDHDCLKDIASNSESQEEYTKEFDQLLIDFCQQKPAYNIKILRLKINNIEPDSYLGQDLSKTTNRNITKQLKSFSDEIDSLEGLKDDFLREYYRRHCVLQYIDTNHNEEHE